jgi:predicted nucleic acid-binding protein
MPRRRADGSWAGSRAHLLRALAQLGIPQLCQLSPVPRNAWRWVETAQYKLTQRGQHRALGVIDLLVCATAVHHGHTVLHVDNDFATVAAVLKEVQQRDVRA